MCPPLLVCNLISWYDRRCERGSKLVCCFYLNNKWNSCDGSGLASFSYSIWYTQEEAVLDHNNDLYSYLYIYWSCCIFTCISKVKGLLCKYYFTYCTCELFEIGAKFVWYLCNLLVDWTLADHQHIKGIVSPDIGVLFWFCWTDMKFVIVSVGQYYFSFV
jgi:hypothetical protein